MAAIEPRKVDTDIYPEVSYFGHRQSAGGPQTVYKRMYPDGEPEILKPGASQKLINHSPDGFQWSYPGSGPAQLALALLLDATTDPQKAMTYYQTFKERFVVGWGDNWAMTRSSILKWIEVMERQSFMDMINHNTN